MTIPRASEAQGSTLTFPGFVANVIMIQTPTLKRNAIDATHLGTVGAHDAIPATLVDAGEFSVECEFDPSYLPPIQGAPGVLSIYFNSTVPQTWTWANAFIVSVKMPQLKTGEKLTAVIAIKVTSVPTIS